MIRFSELREVSPHSRVEALSTSEAPDSNSAPPEYFLYVEAFPATFSFVPLSPGEVGTAVPILQMKKLRHRDVKSPARGFTASEERLRFQDHSHIAIGCSDLATVDK